MKSKLTKPCLLAFFLLTTSFILWYACVHMTVKSDFVSPPCMNMYACTNHFTYRNSWKAQRESSSSRAFPVYFVAS